jgi:hypothetical protein
MLDHLRPSDREALCEPGLMPLSDVAHGREFSGSAIIDLVPDLLGAKLRLPCVEARFLKRRPDRVAGKADEVDAHILARGKSARDRDRIDMSGDCHACCHMRPI